MALNAGDVASVVHTVQVYLFTFIGAAILWGKLGPRMRGVYGLTTLIELFDLSDKKKRVIEAISFLVIGVILAVNILTPDSAPQAFAAGLGWTGLATK